MNNIPLIGNNVSYLSRNSLTAKVTYGTRISEHINTTTSKDLVIPLSIILHESSLESIVRYLKDQKGMRFSEIAKLLNRDQRTVWVTYDNAKKKNVIQEIDTSSIHVPVSIFVSRRLSMLEAIVLYLRLHHDASFIQISSMLGRNYRTVWTVYRRAMKKIEND